MTWTGKFTQDPNRDEVVEFDETDIDEDGFYVHRPSPWISEGADSMSFASRPQRVIQYSIASNPDGDTDFLLTRRP